MQNHWGISEGAAVGEVFQSIIFVREKRKAVKGPRTSYWNLIAKGCIIKVMSVFFKQKCWVIMIWKWLFNTKVRKKNSRFLGVLASLASLFYLLPLQTKHLFIVLFDNTLVGLVSQLCVCSLTIFLNVVEGTQSHKVTAANSLFIFNCMTSQRSYCTVHNTVALRFSMPALCIKTDFEQSFCVITVLYKRT